MEGVGFTKTVQRTFHDEPYILTASGDQESLSLDVEHAKDGRRWRSRFAARFIEEITQRTGNAKKFDVFVRMLLSALAQESDAVYVDVLTARDLEMLRRHANPQGPPSTSMAGQTSDKRYFILTYRAEFDKVHYPLPLPLEERSKEETLQALVGRLRAELADANARNRALEERNTASVSRCGGHDIAVQDSDQQQRIEELQRRNIEVADALRAAHREVEQLRAELRLRAGGSDGEVAKLRAQVRQLQQEARLKAGAVKKEAEQAAKDLRAERQKCDRLQMQLRKLENDTARGGAVGRSRPPSRTPSVERGRAPTRSASRDRGDSAGKDSSRGSSVASSRQRTPSPGANRAGSRGAGPSGLRSREVPSPGARLSPYRGSSLPRPGAGTGRATSSPYGRGNGRERTPSPVAYSGHRTGLKKNSPALSLRERAGAPSMPLGPSAAPTKPAIAGRYANATSAPVRPSSGSRPGREASPGKALGVTAGRREGSAGLSDSGSRPGSLFGLAASLGMVPGSCGVGAHMSGCGGSVGGVSTSAPTTAATSTTPKAVGYSSAASAPNDSADGCDIDARLQALQSFLKQTKHIAG